MKIESSEVVPAQNAVTTKAPNANSAVTGDSFNKLLEPVSVKKTGGDQKTDSDAQTLFLSIMDNITGKTGAITSSDIESAKLENGVYKVELNSHGTALLLDGLKNNAFGKIQTEYNPTENSYTASGNINDKNGLPQSYTLKVTAANGKSTSEFASDIVKDANIPKRTVTNTDPVKSISITTTPDNTTPSSTKSNKTTPDNTPSSTITIPTTKRVIDPLIINMEGRLPTISSATIIFDINSTGKGIELPAFSPGNGFIAIDLNSNGIIDNGKELFGPATGNGFKELQKYDENGDGKIDKNDTVFKKLKVLEFDTTGKQRVSTTAEKNISTLYLKTVKYVYELKDSQGIGKAQVTETGSFDTTDNNSGILQNIDFLT